MPGGSSGGKNGRRGGGWIFTRRGIRRCSPPRRGRRAWSKTRRVTRSGRATWFASCLTRSCIGESDGAFLRQREGAARQGARGNRGAGRDLDGGRPARPLARPRRPVGGSPGRNTARERRGEPGHGEAGRGDQARRRSGVLSAGDRRLN